jgi:hypothetical protein
LHNRGDSDESLDCFNFGNPSPSQFAYQPSLFNEESDQVSRANKEKIKWKARAATIAGKKYVIKDERTIPDSKGGEDPYNEVYDLGSYQDYIKSDRKTNLVIVGKIVHPPGGKAKFQPLVQKKKSTKKGD